MTTNDGECGKGGEVTAAAVQPVASAEPAPSVAMSMPDTISPSSDSAVGSLSDGGASEAAEFDGSSVDGVEPEGADSGNDGCEPASVGSDAAAQEPVLEQVPVSEAEDGPRCGRPRKSFAELRDECEASMSWAEVAAAARAEAEAALGITTAELMTAAVRAQAEIGAAQARQAVALAQISAVRDAEVQAVLSVVGELGSADWKELLAKLPDPTAAEFGAAAGLTTWGAEKRVFASERLVGLMPRTLALLAAGRLDWERAILLALETADIRDPAVLAGIEDAVVSDIEREPSLVVGEKALRRRVRDAVAAVDPDALRKRHDRKVAERGVWVEQLSDGLARLVAQGPAAAIAVMFEAVSAFAEALRANPDVAEARGEATAAEADRAAGSAETTSATATPSEATHAEATHEEGNAWARYTDSSAEPSGTDESHTGEPCDGAPCDRAAGTPASQSTAAPKSSSGATVGAAQGTSNVEPVVGWSRLLDLLAGGSTRWDLHPGRSQKSRDRFDGFELLSHALMTYPGRLADEGSGLSPFGRVTPTLNLVMSAATLVGDDDAPATLSGAGPIPAHVARLLAGDAVWHRVITDPITGVLADLDTRRYTPSVRLRRFITTRDQYCVFAGCTRPATGAGIELDHHEPWPFGDTDPMNLGSLCGTHHLVKTHQAGWRVRRLADGSVRWISPTGLVMTVPPARLLPLIGTGMTNTELACAFDLLHAQIGSLSARDLTDAGPEESGEPDESWTDVRSWAQPCPQAESQPDPGEEGGPADEVDEPPPF